MKSFERGLSNALWLLPLCFVIFASLLSVWDVSAQNVPEQVSSTRNVSAQSVPEQTSSTRNVSAQSVPVQVSSTRNVSAQNVMNQDVSAQKDGRKGVSAKLEEYLTAIEVLPIEEKISETDTLISACSDSSIRMLVAELVFEHYRRSKLMGDEAVAVHIADKWGLSCEAASFADINRQSLIGMKAPSLAPVVSDFGCGRKTVLYFYDTDCSTCRKMTSELVSFIGSIDGEMYKDSNIEEPGEGSSGTVDFVAFYVGSDREAWSSYIAENFPQDFPVRHYMDAERKSDFVTKYGVDGTPRLFLIDGDGIVQGRRIDVGALKILLPGADDRGEAAASVRYGSPESVEFFDRLFFTGTEDIAAADINFVSDYIALNYAAASSAAEKAECKQLLADLLYYLSSRQDEVYRESCYYLISKYILPDVTADGHDSAGKASTGKDAQGIWTTEEDSLYVVSYASLLNDLLSRAQVGTSVPKIRLKGTIYRLDSCGNARWQRGRNANVRLDRIGGNRNILVFYSPGCGDCSEQLEKINAVVSAAGQEKVDEDIRFFLVNVGDMEINSPRLFRKTADLLDFSTLPYLVETDSRGIVARRYFKL